MREDEELVKGKREGEDDGEELVKSLRVTKHFEQEGGLRYTFY